MFYFYISGLIGSLFSFLQFLASPVIGAASDVYGRRPLMILSMVTLTQTPSDSPTCTSYTKYEYYVHKCMSNRVFVVCRLA